MRVVRSFLKVSLKYKRDKKELDEQINISFHSIQLLMMNK